MTTCKVKSIKKIKVDPTPVYDISVENYHNFAVSKNNLVVHNCLPYEYLKTTIYERHVEIYQKCDLLTDELIGLEKKSDGHVDHTPEGINCLTGDTKVSLLDGREVPMVNLVNEYEHGKVNYVYTVNENTLKIEPKPIEKAYKSGTVKSLVRITLDNGEKIECTPEHRFMLRNGAYCEAKDLLVDDSLMPLYRKYPDDTVSMKDYRMYYEPTDDAWHYEHRKFATNVLDKRYLVHHINCVKQDNSPNNLVWCSKQLHTLIHAYLQSGAQSKEANKKRKASLKKWHADNKKTKSYILSHNRTLTDQDIDSYLEEKECEVLKEQERIDFINQYFNVNYNELCTEEKRKYCTAYSNYMANKNIGSKQRAAEHHESVKRSIKDLYGVDPEKLSRSEYQSYAIKAARANNPEYQKRVTSAVENNHKLGKYEKAGVALKEYNNSCKELKRLFPTIDRSKFKEFFGFDYDDLSTSQCGVWSNRYRKKMYEVYNHSVKNIEYIEKQVDVYDLTIKDNPNFALTAGVFVHNSKDQADAFCGALFLASKFAEEYSYSYGDNLQAIIEANDVSEQNKKTQLILDFQDELNRLYNENVENIAKRSRAEEDQYTTFMDISNGIIII